MDATDPNVANRNHVKGVRFATSHSNSRLPGKPVALHHTPPPPANKYGGRHRSHLYMVEPPVSPSRGGNHSNVTSTTTNPPPRNVPRVFTRSTSEPGVGRTPRLQNTAPSLPQPPPSREVIRLDGVRSGPPRMNQYVDTPSEQQRQASSNNNPNKDSHILSSSGGHHLLSIPTIISQPKSVKHNNAKHPKHSDVIINCEEEPMKPQQQQQQQNQLQQHTAEDSIICSKCGKCKCQMCRTPQELPKTWICNKKYECSLQKAVEYCTCLCCVQFFFQTVFNDSEDQDDVSDHPCACCSQRHCCKRWTCMGLFSLCLPCLCCYPLLKGGLSLCKICYNCHRNPQCKCRRGDKLQGSNRLLLDSESSSTT